MLVGKNPNFESFFEKNSHYLKYFSQNPLQNVPVEIGPVHPTFCFISRYT